MPVRVRFAPSPTGFLHVGGARTALFNWLYARRHGGVFVLRIEDTDRARSSDEMVQAILDGMAWLGMRPDEGPFFQSETVADHRRAAADLLRDDRAYRCFCTQEVLAAGRREAESRGDGYRYPRTCRGLKPAEAAARQRSGEPCVVRFAVPAGEVAWHDKVHGPTSFPAEAIEDFVLLRSDGSPTYMLSVVVDDIAMGITHVIRGDDHISNTPKQILLYNALGADVPGLAHVPLILGVDKKRLSKRHGAVSVLAYRDRGYLADAMVNFLALLGWSPGDDRQLLQREALIAAFDLDGIGRSGAVFDLDKLEWLNGRYLAQLPLAELASAVTPRLREAGLWQPELETTRRAWFDALLGLLQPRMRTLADVVELARPYLDPSDDFPYEEKPVRKHLKGQDLLERLHALRWRLDEQAAWSAVPLEESFRALAEERGLAVGQLIHPVRLAVTGRGASPGIFEVLALLGRERSLRRIDRLIRLVEAGGAYPTA